MTPKESEQFNNQDDYKPLSHFVTALELACDNKQTGRFYILTSDSHTAGIDLDNGEICSAKYRITRGTKALNRLYATHWLSFRFDKGHAVQKDNPPLLNTAILLHQFENALEEVRVLPEIDTKKTVTGF